MDKLKDVMKYYDDMLITDANSPIEKGKPMYNIIDLWRFAESYHTAKMAEVTDEDILQASINHAEFIGFDGEVNINIARQVSFMYGARAMRNGEIKHKEG